MVFGGTADERIQLNEDTLWNGGPRAYHRNAASAYLPQIRQLLAEGRQAEAQDLATREFMGDPIRQASYQILGNLRIQIPRHWNASGYRRELSLDHAVTTVTYKADGVSFVRRACLEVHGGPQDRFCSDSAGRFQVRGPQRHARLGGRGRRRLP
jgi:alpha-L-fucosidase 2